MHTGVLARKDPDLVVDLLLELGVQTSTDKTRPFEFQSVHSAAKYCSTTSDRRSYELP